MINQKYISPFFMWLLVIIGAVICYLFLPANKIFSLGVSGWILFAACAIYWIFIVSKGLLMHQQAVRSVAGIDHLLTNGVFKFSRHPLYGAHIIMTWGIVLLIATPKTLAITFWLTIVLAAWAKLEELGLEQKFGQAYFDYKKITPMFIPRFWRKF